ncbi:MAG: Crp/Fnr family transcriptional regulator [Alphaproteobacteria bacterium]
MVTAENTEQRLDGVELFLELAPADIRNVEEMCSWLRFQAGDQVFDQEHKSREVFFVVSGSVRVLTYKQNRREVALANVVAGDYFGELAAIDGKGRSARVVAVEQCLIASLPGPTFMDLMHRHPTIAVRVVNRFAYIIRTLDARVADLSSLSESQRVMTELVRISRPDAKRPGGWIIASLPNHREIASWAGTSRDVVAQTIGELARDGVVERRTMGLIIKDWDRLKLMARV